MSDLTNILTTINTLISTFRDIAILIILILGIKYLGKEIAKGVKQMPSWINLFFVEMQKAKTLDRALTRKY